MWKNEGEGWRREGEEEDVVGGRGWGGRERMVWERERMGWEREGVEKGGSEGECKEVG